MTSIALAREDILLGPLDALLAGAGLTVQVALRVASQGRQGGVRASQLEVLAAEVALIARPGLGTSRSKWPRMETSELGRQAPCYVLLIIQVGNVGEAWSVFRLVDRPCVLSIITKAGEWGRQPLCLRP